MKKIIIKCFFFLFFSFLMTISCLINASRRLSVKLQIVWTFERAGLATRALYERTAIVLVSIHAILRTAKVFSWLFHSLSHLNSTQLCLLQLLEQSQLFGSAWTQRRLIVAYVVFGIEYERRRASSQIDIVKRALPVPVAAVLVGKWAIRFWTFKFGLCCCWSSCCRLPVRRCCCCCLSSKQSCRWHPTCGCWRWTICAAHFRFHWIFGALYLKFLKFIIRLLKE